MSVNKQSISNNNNTLLRGFCWPIFSILSIYVNVSWGCLKISWKVCTYWKVFKQYTSRVNKCSLSRQSKPTEEKIHTALLSNFITFLNWYNFRSHVCNIFRGTMVQKITEPNHFFMANIWLFGEFSFSSGFMYIIKKFRTTPNQIFMNISVNSVVEFKISYISGPNLGVILV